MKSIEPIPSPVHFHMDSQLRVLSGHLLIHIKVAITFACLNVRRPRVCSEPSEQETC
jgi:hypothetical protein